MPTATGQSPKLESHMSVRVASGRNGALQQHRDREESVHEWRGTDELVYACVRSISTGNMR